MSRDPASKADASRQVGNELRLLASEIHALDSRAADTFGLNRSDLRCLDVLSQLGEASPGALARALGMSTGGLSISIWRLERAGYVAREIDLLDRRRVTVKPTAKTAGLEAHIFGQLQAQVRDLLADYSQHELLLIRQFLERVRVAVGAAGTQKGS